MAKMVFGTLKFNGNEREIIFEDDMGSQVELINGETRCGVGTQDLKYYGFAAVSYDLNKETFEHNGKAIPFNSVILIVEQD